MRIEHFAFNVTDPIAIAEWYCSHLGFTVAKKFDQHPHTHFLADSTGNVMIEIYNNPSDDVPHYPDMHFLQLHLAFVSDDPRADAKRLMEAGAKVVDEVLPPDGSVLLMLKDPWGFAIQLCKRGTPMLKQ